MRSAGPPAGSFNLAVALGDSVTGALTWSHSWIYLLASLLGGASAAALFTYLHPSFADDDRPLLAQVEQPIADSGIAT